MSNECEYRNHCGECEGEIKSYYAMTAYHWDKESGKPDPNRDYFACEKHHADYVEYWTIQWEEYYSQGLL